jgi:hypothetical protein
MYMKQNQIIITLLIALTAACSGLNPATPESQPEPGGDAAEVPAETETARLDSGPALPDFGPAPELSGDTWLNSDAPLRLADLRGQVVMIDMWTFG